MSDAATAGAAGGGLASASGPGPGSGLQPPSLPEDEGDTYNWDEIEENWLHEIAMARAKEDQGMVLQYDKEETILHAELDDAVCEHNRLTETLLQARVLVDEKKADIEWLLDDFKRRRKTIEDQRAADDLRVRAWITKGRKQVEARLGRGTDAMQQQNGGGGGDDHATPFLRARSSRKGDSAQAAGGHPAKAKSFALRNGGGGGGGHPHTDTRHASGLPTLTRNSDPAAANGHTQAQSNADGSVAVVNSDGDSVGTVVRIAPENHWVQTLLERPIQRPVEIRLGRKFTQTHLDSIYEGHDQKKSKWLSFMIQATGELQDRACQTCAKGQGLFSLCIIVGGPDFPRCGNCEWNKQGCHGASGRTLNRQASAKHQKNAERPGVTAATPPNQTAPNAAGASKTESFMAVDESSQTSNTSKDAHRRSRVNQTPTTPQQFESFLVRELSPSAMSEEITLDTLALKDDGMIFLEPDLMRGVPLRKITPDHAYWEPGWKPIEGAVQNKLDEWMDKLVKLKALPESSLTDKERTAVFQAGRQVNRGKATTRYLSTCDFHPYQLVAKQWITPSLTHYDTLFRMVATLDELAKFRLDVSPLQWLRQRLYEIACEKKASFKLDRVIAKLYHDPKLSQLRSKNGFGNIGRPSAANKPRNSDGSGGGGGGTASLDGGSEKKPTGEKRKEAPLADSVMSTPTKRVFVDSDKRSGKESSRQSRSKATKPDDSLQPEAATPTASQQSHRNRKQSSAKHREQKAAAAAAAATTAAASASATPSRAASNGTDGTPLEDDDLAYSGYTSTDSLTKDTVVKKDWRVHQVKTMGLATNPRTTQYWHWVDEKHAFKKSGPGGPQDFDPMFEHQVLKETEPTTGWGVFKEPIDFHLRLRELTEVAFAPDSQKVVIGTRQVEGIERRGNVLAQFKRERTKRRFLTFMYKKGVALRRASGSEIETEWNEMQADVMAGNESD